MTLGQRITHAREHARIKQKDVAEHFGISSQAVSQWEADRTRPDSQRLARLARLLEVRLEWLLDETGSVSFEEQCQLSSDVRHTVRVPIIDTLQASDWTDTEGAIGSTVGSSYLQTDLGVSSIAFALVIQGKSMEPEFQSGDKVIIDPSVQPRPGDFVVAMRDQDQEVTFKKYRLKSEDEGEGNVIELVPVNPDWPTLLIDQQNLGRIIGTMVEHRRYRRS